MRHPALCQPEHSGQTRHEIMREREPRARFARHFPPSRPFKPLREGWREYLVSFLVVASLLVGAVVLERLGLWPDGLKTARDRHIDALREQRERPRSEGPAHPGQWGH